MAERAKRSRGQAQSSQQAPPPRPQQAQPSQPPLLQDASRPTPTDKEKAGQGGPSIQRPSRPTKEELSRNQPDNRWLFRNEHAWTKYNGAFGSTRTFAKGYYFFLPQDHEMSEWERKFLNDRIDFWKLRKFISLDGKGSENTTRLFYANMEPLPGNEFDFTTVLYKFVITITPAIVAAALDLDNEGEEIYPFRNWPKDAKENEYKQWITGIGDVHGRKLYCSHLPAVHWLLFVIINNILLPKSQIKTNLESGTIYLLRHLLEMDKKINVPYLIVSHMLQAGKDKVMSLPYSHILLHLIAQSHRPLPPHVESENLLRYLPKFRWVSQDRDNGTIF